jgi:uncharacterized protein (TIGR00369 family)
VTIPEAVLGVDELAQFVSAPTEADGGMRVEAVTDVGVVMRMVAAERHLRPGGTLSGPTLMTLADAAAWLAIMSRIGPVVLAVTTSLHIDFLRKPELHDVIATGELIKLGRRLAVVDVAMRTDGRSELLAKSQVTYSIPRD